MTNHPNRRQPRDSRLLTPISPEELRSLIDQAGITQADAAARCHAAARTMRQWLAGDRRMPLAASEVLMLSVWPLLQQANHTTLLRWVRPEFVAELVSARQKRPLTAQQLDKLIAAHVGGAELADGEYSAMVMFAAAVERAHGIERSPPRLDCQRCRAAVSTVDARGDALCAQCGLVLA